MGLRWTFMPVYWKALEPDRPVDLTHGAPAAWQELDAFVVAAQSRKLNILMQAPVVGGNAGGPPAWAGRREAGKSAPQNMDALIAFAGKLAERYRPDGTLRAAGLGQPVWRPRGNWITNPKATSPAGKISRAITPSSSRERPNASAP